MFGNDIFTRVKRSENKKMAEIAQFLHENDLSVDTTVEVFITVTRDEKLIACGGIAGNIIKCVAGNDSNLLIVFYVQRAFTDKQQIKRKAQSFD